jgi:methylglutaconyl-CoA hydratase
VDYQRIRYETVPRVIWITLATPERLNRIDDRTWEELLDAFSRANTDRDRSVVVVRGSGRVFSAGGDLGSDIADASQRGDDVFRRRMVRHIEEQFPAFRAIECSPKTTIAALNGSAYGGGVVLAGLCDLVVAVRGATLSFADARWGIADAPGAARLPRKLGSARAMEVLATARELGAEEAARVGIVHRLCGREDFDATVAGLVDEVLRVSPTARRCAKHAFTRDLAALTTREQSESTIGAEVREGIAAFREGRSPAWREGSAIAPGSKGPAR